MFAWNIHLTTAHRCALLIIVGFIAIVLASPSRATPPDVIHLPGIVRDFHKTDANFAVTPVGGNGHYAGNVGLLIGANNQPIYAGPGYKVNGEWHNAGGQPIPPHLYAAGGGGGGVVAVTTVPSMANNPTVDSFNSAAGPYGGSNVGPAPTFVGGSPMPTVSQPAGMPPLVNNVTYSGNGTTTLSADVHCNNFTVQNNRTLQISGNRKILVENSCTFYNHVNLKILANSTLTLYIKNLCSFDNNIDANVNTASPSKFTIINLGTHALSLGNHVAVYGTMISPNAPLQMNNNSDFMGSFTGQTVILANSAGFHNDGSGGPVPMMCSVQLHDTAGAPGTVSSGGITSAASFAAWYSDVLGTNLSAMHTIDLVRNSSGVYEYLDDAFHPIDNQLFGNEGQSHNNYFTFEITVPFVHHACSGAFFEFQGDDDAWMFINGKLALDLGGVVPGTPQYVEIDRIAGLQDGQTYTMHFFYAQRQSNVSVFHLRTNLDLISSATPNSVSAGFD